MITHEMTYKAGRVGFAEVGLPDVEPHWGCSCGTGWRFPAKAMPSRKTGNNQIEAEREHTRHVHAIR